MAGWLQETRQCAHRWRVKADAVYQSIDDPNDVTVVHDFETREAAQAFIASPELKAAMEETI